MIALTSFPDSGEYHQAAILAAYVVGLFAIVFDLPFIKPICRDQTASLQKGLFVCRFFRYGFGLGVDHTVAHRSFPGPVRDQAPVHGLDMTGLICCGHDCRYVGRWCNIIRGSNRSLRSGKAQILTPFRDFGKQCKSSTHIALRIAMMPAPMSGHESIWTQTANVPGTLALFRIIRQLFSGFSRLCLQFRWEFDSGVTMRFNYSLYRADSLVDLGQRGACLYETGKPFADAGVAGIAGVDCRVHEYRARGYLLGTGQYLS